MKTKKFKIIKVLVLLLPCLELFGSEFPIDTILYSGPKENRINFVFLSDGYQKHELTKFKTDVDSSVIYFFNEPPLSNYKNYFNVFAIRVPSNQSGASHPRTAPDCPDSNYHPKLKVDNYFGSTFDASNIHRLLVSYRSDSVYNVLTRNFPDYDQAFILVNSTFYGGSGGGIPTSSTNYASAEVILHEFTHSFARLSDEYGGNCTYKSLLGPNVTDNKAYLQVPWNIWIDSTTPVPTPATGDYIGIPGFYEGAYYCDTGWYRPAISCKMRDLYARYCVVCKQAMIERIHNLVSPVDSYSPEDLYLETADTTLNFHVNIIKTIPNTIETLWYLDSTLLSGEDSLVLNTKSLPEGFSSITALVNDTTPMTRDSSHLFKNTHKQIIHWEILKNGTGVKLESEAGKLYLNVFPNPFDEIINIELTLTDSRSVTAILTDIKGNPVYQNDLHPAGEGKNLFRFDLSNKNLPNGSYYLVLKTGNSSLGRELIRIGR